MRNEVKSAVVRNVITRRSPFDSKREGGKIAIMSDSHDNIPNMEKALKYINEQGIDFIIHCGDLAAPVMLSKVMIPNFKGQIHLVHGNIGDPDLLEEVAKGDKRIRVYGDRGKLDIGNRKIAFCHFAEEAKKLAQTGQFDLVFYGHTHRPWLKTQINADVKSHADSHRYNISVDQRSNQRRSAVLVNPGTLAGMFAKATFAIYDTKTDKLELKILEKI